MLFDSTKYKFSLPNDAPAWANELTTQMRKQALDLSRALASATGTTLVIAGTEGVSGSTSSTTSSNGTSDTKSGTQFVTAGVSAWVPFPKVFVTIPVVTLCFIAQIDGGFGSINTSNLNITTAGFLIPATDIMLSGTIFYIAHTN